MVASAISQQTSEDASRVLTRVTRHGLDLSTKVTTTHFHQSIKPYQYDHQHQQHQQDELFSWMDNDKKDWSSSAGTSPYESQLRNRKATTTTTTPTIKDMPNHTQQTTNKNTSTSHIPNMDHGIPDTPNVQQTTTGNRSMEINTNHPDDDAMFSKHATQMKEDQAFSLSTSSAPLKSDMNRTAEINPNLYLLHADPQVTSSSSSSLSSSLSSSVNERGTMDSNHHTFLSSTTPAPDPTSSSMENFQSNTAATTTYTTATATTSEPSSSGLLEPPRLASDPHVEMPISHPQLDGSNDALPRLQYGKAIPASRMSRAMGFASLGAGLAMGTVSEWARRLLGSPSSSSPSSSSPSSIVTNDANANRVAATLCRMRGAALKMGQMLSIQDESLLPPALSQALHQVRQGADAMPHYQLIQQLESQLGPTWETHFETFEERPFAAASIGQVHRATIRDATTGILQPVVVKVQYPGVAQSIESDLRNLAMLVTMTGLAPKGLFIENVIRVGRDELKVECNYINEMANQQKFKELVEADSVLVRNGFVVPEVIPELTTEQVITSAYSPGGTIDKVSQMEQEERNRIGRTILYLTMKELFDWRLMQTDPNWGNFLYDVGTRQTTLIDFGATREYSKSFVDGYLRIVWASANRDEETLMAQSRRMKFLTGDENEEMLRAHKLSGFTVGEPFWKNEPFDFRASRISTRMSEHTSVFLRHRLTYVCS